MYWERWQAEEVYSVYWEIVLYNHAITILYDDNYWAIQK